VRWNGDQLSFPGAYDIGHIVAHQRGVIDEPALDQQFCRMIGEIVEGCAPAPWRLARHSPDHVDGPVKPISLLIPGLRHRIFVDIAVMADFIVA
jgi:hypothetical protein